MGLPRRRQSGFTLVEIILGLGIGTLILFYNLKMMQTAESDMRAKLNAEAMQSFTTAATNYFLANRTALLQAMADGTGASTYCIHNDIGGTPVPTNNTTLHTCAVDVPQLRSLNLLPASMRNTNLYWQKWSAIYRRVYDGGGNPTDNVELLIVGTMRPAGPDGSVTVTDMGELQRVAQIAGASGGYVPDSNRVTCKFDDGSATYQACGGSGGWSVNLLNFVNSAH